MADKLVIKKTESAANTAEERELAKMYAAVRADYISIYETYYAGSNDVNTFTMTSLKDRGVSVAVFEETKAGNDNYMLTVCARLEVVAGDRSGDVSSVPLPQGSVLHEQVFKAVLKERYAYVVARNVELLRRAHQYLNKGDMIL